MPELCRFYGIIIRMYFMDHNPPHFHAEYQGQRAEFDIRTLELIAGAGMGLTAPCGTAGQLEPRGGRRTTFIDRSATLES